MSMTVRFGKTEMTPEMPPLHSRIRAAVRRCIGDEVERLIGMGGADDCEDDAGDEGEENDDREPALGWTADGERGAECAFLHDEDEPSLGWTELQES